MPPTGVASWPLEPFGGALSSVNPVFLMGLVATPEAASTSVYVAVSATARRREMSRRGESGEGRATYAAFYSVPGRAASCDRG